MYEMLCAHDKLAPGVLDKYPNLVAFMRRFEELPNLSAYLKSVNLVSFLEAAGTVV